MTEFWPDHDGDACYLHLVPLKDNIFLDNWKLIIARLYVAILYLFYLDFADDFCLISEASYSGSVRHNRLISSVAFVLSWVLIDSRIAESDFVCRFFIIDSNILAILLNCCFFELFNNLLDWVLEEALKWEDLLGHKPMKFEVAIYDLPAVVLLNWIDVGTKWRVWLHSG